MKHAYLILAHTEFDLLKKLISALDDVRNDIYIHYDKKVVHIPELNCDKATLRIIKNRIDVRWGDVSVIEAELELFREASHNGNYAYFHLLSGVDLPIKPQDEIYNFYTTHRGKEFIGYYQGDIKHEIERKVRKYHLFPKDFRKEMAIGSVFKSALRAIFIRFQYFFGFSRNKHINFKKGTQWVSITQALVALILSQEKQLLKIYSNTFCSDEIFIQTICWNSDFRKNIYNAYDEAVGSQRKIGWKEGKLLDWTEKDYDEIITSGLMFARKFNSQDIKIVDKIIKGNNGIH